MNKTDAKISKRQYLMRIVLVALGIVFSLLLVFHTVAVFDRGPLPSQASTAQASGERHELAPGLTHLSLHGEGYALGHLYGRLLGPDIRDLIRYLSEELLGNTLVHDLALLQAWRLDSQIPEEYRQEMRGVAEAAQVDYADILLINVYDDLVYLVGCSSAVLLPSERFPLKHARNVDYPLPYLAKHKLVVDLETKGVHLRTVAFPGYLGVLTGMSSRGLSLASHTSVVADNRIGKPSGFVYRDMLEHGHSLREMHEILAHQARTIGNNLALSDASSEAALALEFDATHLEERKPEQGRLFVTNHFQTSSMRAFQAEASWTTRAESEARIDALQRDLASPSSGEDKILQAALSSMVPDRSTRGVANSETILSVIMEPASGRLLIAKGMEAPVTEGGWLELAGTWAERSPQAALERQKASQE